MRPETVAVSEMLVKKLQYTKTGESDVISSLWEKERMEILARKLSHRNAAQSSSKLLFSITDIVKMLALENFAEMVPKNLYRKRQYRSASQKTAVEKF